MTHLTFYGGAGEIGGNKFLLEDAGARIYLDFGQSFNFGADYFYDYLQPRSVNGLECLFEFDLVPRIPRLYNQKALRFTDLPYEKPDIDAVFVSHHHSDHVGHLGFLDESIPVYMGHGTKKIVDAYSTLYSQLVDLGDHETINLFRSGDALELKHLLLRPVHVEHSTPGAYGYVIERGDGNIVFTGDFRRHGPKKELTDEFIHEAAKASPVCMLCEGTRMTPDPEKQYTEDGVRKKVDSIVSESKGIVYANFAMSNIDRFRSFYQAAVENNRTFVLDTKMAYVLEKLREEITDLPDPRTDEHVKVYFRISKSCEFQEKDYYKFEREYMGNMVTYRELGANQTDYLVHTNFNKLMEFVYVQPEKADYIYSSSEHFLEGEDNEAVRTVLYNWLGHFGIELHKAHCSGHAGKSDIEHAVKTVKPDVLIPVHTQHPEEFCDFHGDVRVPEKGSRLEF